MPSALPPWQKPCILPIYTQSACKLLTLAPSSMGLFRYLLEGYENLAGFTVINPATASLKLFYSRHQEAELNSALKEIQMLVPINVQPWPFPSAYDA